MDFTMFGRNTLNGIQHNHPENTILIDTTNNMSPSFLSFSTGINQQTYLNFIKRYQEIKDCEELIIDITTEGGSATYALMIADVISNHPGKTVAQISKFAFSGGAIIALACKEIRMSPYAVLGPIDAQLNSWLPSIRHLKPAVSNVNSKEFNSPTYLQIFTDYFTNYLTDVENSFNLKLMKILKNKYSKEEIQEIIYVFTKKYEHNFPIMKNELPEFLNVQTYEPKVEEQTRQCRYDTLGGCSLDDEDTQYVDITNMANDAARYLNLPRDQIEGVIKNIKNKSSDSTNIENDPQVHENIKKHSTMKSKTAQRYGGRR